MRLLRALTALAILFGTASASAQFGSLSPTAADPGAEPSFEVPGLDRVRVDEKLDRDIPLDLTFRDLDGHVHQLREFVSGNKPVVLTFAYHTCPTLCSMVLDAVATSLRQVPWSIGQEYDVITISLDPHDDLHDCGGVHHAREVGLDLEVGAVGRELLLDVRQEVLFDAHGCPW